MSVTLLSNDNKCAHSLMKISLTIFETTGASTCAGTMCAAGKFGAPGSTSLSADTCTDCKPGKYSTAGASIVFYVLSSSVSLSYVALPPFPRSKQLHMCVYAYANVSICTHLQCDAHTSFVFLCLKITTPTCLFVIFVRVCVCVCVHV